MQQVTKLTEEGESADATAMDRIVAEEERVLARVHRTIEARRATATRTTTRDYDAELIALRDQVREARMEDIPPLIEEMERLHHVATRRAQVVDGMVDPNSPYFGRLVLQEEDRRREVLIGRSTFLDSTTGIRIVDWRDAPVSRIYYRYEEGDDYDEYFGGRDVEGDVVVRRSLSITGAKLKRIGAPQGTFLRGREGKWREASATVGRLRGGQGAAMRPEAHHELGKLGVGDSDGDRQEDKHLSEITALIDPRQFELISHPTTGLVVIQGGAGSGKTTIGLHRLAYLAFQDRARFRPERMLVVVFNDALVRYISRVLPALGVGGVHVMTYEAWAAKQRRRHLRHLPGRVADDTPMVVMRFKKHPVVLRLIDEMVEELSTRTDDVLVQTAKKLAQGGKALRVWRDSANQAPGARAERLWSWLRDPEEEGRSLPLETRHAIERTLKAVLSETRDILGAWAELLTGRDRIQAALRKHAPDAFTEREVEWVVGWCARRCDSIIHWAVEHGVADRDGRDEPHRDAERVRAVDGIVEEDVMPSLDVEDDTLLLRLVQRMRGPLTRKGRSLEYEHIFVDEAQDLSPVELATVLDTVTKGESVTLAGDVAQRLHMENGFSDWASTLDDLGYNHVEIEPLKLSYRSTHEILDFAVEVLGPLKNDVSGEATRHGAPVEVFSFPDTGSAVGFLSEALRDLVRAEPLASVAVIARYPEQADIVHRGLVHGEVPNLRRIAEQDFPFRPGVDVTDVRQVKGLEFDYVVLVEANRATYPEDDEARHLMHIAATRAAHQLWVLFTKTPSDLIPAKFRPDDV